MDMDKFFKNLNGFIGSNQNDYYNVIKEYDMTVQGGEEKGEDFLEELPEITVLREHMDKEMIDVLKKVLFEHCVEDIFLAFVEV